MSAADNSIRGTFAGKHLLVTGVTGFLGKVWLAMVLDRLPEVRKITVIARGQKGQSAADRFAKIYECSPAFRPLREKHGLGLRALIADKVEVLDAPLAKPLCGLSQEEAARRMADVDVVVHFAGLVDFEPDPRSAIDANIIGASNVADLAALTPSKRYVHCSTCFVAGMKTGDVEEILTPGTSPNGTVFDPRAEVDALEADLAKLTTRGARVDLAMTRAKRLGWPNIYTYTKGLAEHLVELRTDVHGTTVRPAVVECARSFPFTGWNEGVNTSAPLVWLLSTTFRRLPARGTNNFDVVPVDTVARAMVIVTAAMLRDEAKQVYHVASSHVNPMKMARAMELTTLAMRKKHSESESWFERHVLKRLDCYPVDADRPRVMSVEDTKRVVGEVRQIVRKMDVKGYLPPKVYEDRGPKLETDLRALGTDLRANERQLQSVSEMLKQFRPFIHDLDYTFHTTNLVAATAELSDAEREEFGFDVHTIDWRKYWLEVQVPGLETWSIPVLRGDKVHDDPPLPKEHDAHPAHEVSVVGITVQA